MEKITTANWGDVNNLCGCTTACAQMGIAHVTDENFWVLREKSRMSSHTYTPINIPGDDPMRFLHQSLDDLDKVSYTKNADKGREDLQTRTTLEDYCDKFGLEVLTTVPHCENLTPASAYESSYHNLADAVQDYFNSKAETIRLKKKLQEMI